MPKKTFYNLPEEKRKKILDAACSEFLRVPYEEVSINQIIKIAQIPRGSFYQYFDDKDDLFDYFIHIYKEKLMSWFIEKLNECNGDIFGVVERCYEAFINNYSEYLAGGIMNIFCNSLLRGKVSDSMNSKENDSIKDKILDAVDIEKTTLKDKEEAMKLLEIMSVIIHDSVGSAIMVQSKKVDDAEVKRFYDRIEFLRKKFTKRVV